MEHADVDTVDVAAGRGAWRVPDHGEWLAAPHAGVVIASILAGFVLPTIVSTAICYSVPSTG